MILPRLGPMLRLGLGVGEVLELGGFGGGLQFGDRGI